MAAFAARDGSGRLLDPVTPESLRPFLYRAAGGGTGPVDFAASASLDAERADGGTERLRATPQPDGSWTVRLLGPDRPEVIARGPNTDAVFDLLRSWAADDGWWQEAFSWAPARD